MPHVDVVNLTVWHQIESYLPPGTTLNSVYRSPQEQLNFIVKKARSLGFQFTKTPTVADRASWEPALKFLRARNYKVAPPGKSMHQHWIAYDFGGPDLQKIAAGVRRAVADGRIKLTNSKDAIKLETANHCVHVEIVEALIHNDAFSFFATA
jgi:hypothetical protein